MLTFKSDAILYQLLIKYDLEKKFHIFATSIMSQMGSATVTKIISLILQYSPLLTKAFY